MHRVWLVNSCVHSLGSEYNLYVENESDKEVIWWVVSIGLAVTAALAWALTFLEQTGRIKLN